MFENLLQRSERLARVQANRALLRFVNGIDWLIRDPRDVVGRTPYDVIFKENKLEVRRYHLGRVKPRYPVPILLIPPLMVKPFIFDLMPHRSLVAYLLQRGFQVYLVDFGEPDEADAFVTLDNYVLDWMPAACEAVKKDAGSSEISLAGYCMGGIFALAHTAANHDPSVRNIVGIGVPVDSSKMGLFAWIAKFASEQVNRATERIGNVPGGISSRAFRLFTPMKNLTRYSDLFMNMWNHEFVNGFDAMNQWVGQFIDYPQNAFIQFNKEFMQRNKLVKGQMTFRGKVADLRRTMTEILSAFRVGRTGWLSSLLIRRHMTLDASRKIALAVGAALELYVGLAAQDQRLTVEAAPGKSDGQDRIRAGRLVLDAGAQRDELPTVRVPKTGAEIKPDGILDEDAWDEAPVLTFSDTMDRDIPTRFPTKLRLLYDEENLYVAFESVDHDITCPYEKRDDPIYDHETVELFLMPKVSAPETGPYVELQASPKGIIFDASFTGRRRGMDRSFDAAQVVGTRLDGTLNDSSDRDRGWVSEWVVPWKSLRFVEAAPKAGEEWRMNAFRIEKHREGGELKGEYTAWSPPRVGDFHNIKRFGRLIFGGEEKQP